MSRLNISDYYILQKFPDGWMMAHSRDHFEIFVSNFELVQYGYLPQKKSKSPLVHAPLVHSSSSPVIQVPISKIKHRNSAPPTSSVDIDSINLETSKEKSIKRKSDGPIISLIN